MVKTSRRWKKKLREQANRYARGYRVSNPDGRLALYINCKEWGVLPDKGGWYDQSPEVIESFKIISEEIRKEEIREQKKQERKNRR